MGVGAHQASAVITFAFDDNPGPDGQFTYTAPQYQGELGQLVYDSSVPVDLAVDSTGEGGTEFFYNDATFSFSASVGAVMMGPFPQTWMAPLTDGVMQFTSAGGDLLFSGSFGTDLPAALVVVVDTGSINVSLEVGGLNYIAGSTLLTDLSNELGTEVLGFLPPFDGVWTLTNMPPITTIMPGPKGPDRVSDIFFYDFIANSSFSGTTGIRVVPSPGMAALAGLSAVCIGLRRHR